MGTGNGNARHADAVTSHLLDESERHEREAAKRRREFEDLLQDVDDTDDDSKVGLAAVEQLGRVAMASQHDSDPPKSGSSAPPGAPWWVRVLPPRFRWVAALVAIAAALAALLQALGVLRGARQLEPPAHPERHQGPP